MYIRKEEKQTFSQHFLTPASTAHRRYEALRAYFVEGLSSKEAAGRFGYSPGSFRGLVHQFRLDPKRSFFATGRAAANEPGRPDTRRQKVVALRKQNLSVYDISRALARDNVESAPSPSARSSNSRASPACHAAATRNAPRRPGPLPPT